MVDTPEAVARELVTARLIRESERPTGPLSTPQAAEAWLKASEPYHAVLAAVIERIEPGDEEFAHDLIAELAGYVATSMEVAAEVTREQAGKIVQHSIDSENTTGLDYWRNIAERLAKRR